MAADPAINRAVPLRRRLGLALLVLYGTGITVGAAYGQKIETAQRRQRSNIFGLGPVLHNKLAVDA